MLAAMPSSEHSYEMGYDDGSEDVVVIKNKPEDDEIHPPEDDETDRDSGSAPARRLAR